MNRFFYTLILGCATVVALSVMQCVSPGSNSDDLKPCDRTDNGYFVVFHPQSGQSLKIGASDSIQWVKRTFDSTVSLFLYKGQVIADTIAAAVKNSGNVPWKVSTVPAGDGYRIKVVNVADTSQYDFSCSFSIFSTYSGKFTMLRPEAGAICSAGVDLQIRWESTGSPGDSVSLSLCVDSLPMSTIAAAIGNTGAFVWRVPAGLLTKNNYRVKVASRFDPGLYALSGAFTIVGQSVDWYEFDNVRDSAKALDLLGKPQYHTLTVNDIDWVKFSADSGKAYAIEISGGVGGYLYYGKDTVTSQFLKKDTMVDTAILWTAPKTGAYYIKFSSTQNALVYYSISITPYSPLAALVFIAPTASTIWNAGQDYQIQWKPDSTVLGKYANIYVFKGAVQLKSIVNSAPNSGVFSYSVDPKLESGSDYRIKIANSADTLKAGISAAFTIQGCASDSFEPDGKRDLASKLAINGKAQVHTLSLHDTDWIGFNADSGKVYRLLASGTLPVAIKLFYGSALSPTYDTVWSALGVNVISLRWPCAKSGTWYAQIVLGPSGSGCGGYSFEAADLDSLQLIAISSPAQGVSWNAGSSQQIKWTPDTTVLSKNVNIYLFKGQQQLFPITTAIYNSGVYNWTLPYGIVTGSDYRIRIANYSNSTLGGNSAFFTINGVAPDAYEPDNKRDSASTLSPLGKAQAHTLSLNDTDWVKFSLDSGVSYLMQSSGNIPTRVYLYYGSDAGYTTYFYSSSTTAALRWVCPKKGVWCARIAAYSSSSTGSAYSFNVSPFDSLTLLSISSPALNANWTAGSTYQILWTPDTTVLGTYVNIYLFKGSQQLMYLTGGSSNRGSYSWYVPNGISTGSDYRIKIENGSNSGLWGLSALFSITGTAPDTFEPDNIRDQASTLTLGKAQAHTLTFNDTDWVKFNADSMRNYIIQCYGAVATRIYLYNNTDVYYTYYFSATTSSSTSSMQWTCGKSGDWYARIISYSGGSVGGNYSFNISAFDSLTAIAFTSPAAGSTLNAGASAYINWAPDSAILGTYVYADLYKGGRPVAYLNEGYNNGSLYWTVPAGVATGADYRIKISNSSNNAFCAYGPLFSIAGISMDAYEPDDTISKASTITADGIAQSHSLSLGDIDWTKFSAQKDSIYLITASSTSAELMYINEVLWDSAGSIYLSFGDGSQNPKMVWRCEKSGTYCIQIQGSEYGNYALSVKTYGSGSSISFVNPTSLSIWSAGSSYSIQWAPDTVLFGQNVRMELCIDTMVVQTISSSTQNRGTYSWTPPSGMASGSKYAIKMSNANQPLLFGYSPVFTISGINPDAYERDDSVTLSHAIATTGVAENHTLSLNDRDWYNFSATANYLYAIKTTGATSSMSTQLVLYNTDGRTSLATARSTTADSSATLLMLCQTTGTYYFRVLSSTTGSYQAMVAAYDSTKFGLVVTSPATADSFAIGQVDTIRWSSQVSVGGNVDIYLNNAAGVVQTIVANVANSGTYRWTIPSTITPASDLYVRIISRASSRIYGNSGVFKIKAN
jgi:hypothetical protein